ncbi:MAG: WecB/TagA/CpsF family glycosyltransferase [Anaerolineales bacterium]|nr:WecB/TagA/CpsF family glycosyltransferase [Anaerolineales bacterium]
MSSEPLTPPPPIRILGVPVHPMTMASTLAWVAAAVAARAPRQVCTANPEFVMTAQRDAAFRQVLNAADLVLADGVGLLWAARRQGRMLPERVAGSDLIYQLAELAARHGWRVFYLGAADGVAAEAAARLAARYPGLVAAGTYAGSPRVEAEPEIVERVRAARPDVLLVAYGAPAQDKWISRNKAALGVPVSVGVGGAFDFVAGVAVRAPRWARRLGLEWLHRLIRQPWRLRRILTAVAAFPLAVLTQKSSPPD